MAMVDCREYCILPIIIRFERKSNLPRANILDYLKLNSHSKAFDGIFDVVPKRVMSRL